MSGSNSSAPGSGAVPELLPLGLTVHSLAPPQIEPDDARNSSRVASGRLKMLAVLAVCAAPVIASYFTYFVIKPQARSNYAELITPPRELPAGLPLRTLAGEPVQARSLRGQWLLVVVAGAACDVRCEQHLLLQRQLRETLGREKERIDKIWLVTDEAPPRPAVLRGIAAEGTAASTAVLRVPRDALAGWLVPAEGQRLEDHVYLIDPMGLWMMRAPVDAEPAKFKRDVDRLLRASASWDQPGR